MNPGSLQHMVPPLSGSASEKHSYNPVWWVLFSAIEATGALRRGGYVAAPDSQLGSGGLFRISSGPPPHSSHLLTPPHRSPHPKGKCWASTPECRVIWAPLPPASALPRVGGDGALPGLSLEGLALEERVESEDPYLWVLYSGPSLILGVSTRDAQPGPSALKMSVSPHLRRDKA